MCAVRMMRIAALYSRTRLFSALVEASDEFCFDRVGLLIWARTLRLAPAILSLPWTCHTTQD